MARCVLPVLVGPSTAVTPAPRARRSRSAGGEKENGIKGPALTPLPAFRLPEWWGGDCFLYHNVTLERPVLKVWNESGTNRGRIGDSDPVRLRSLRYMALAAILNTRSGGIARSGASPWRQNH